MPWINTAEPLDVPIDQLYNGMDSLLTHEINQALLDLGPPPPVYTFERALQGPFMEIMLRGFRIDSQEREKQTIRLRAEIDTLSRNLNSFAGAIWGKPLNPRSPDQLKRFFYETMQLPEQWASTKGERRVSTNKDALENLDTYFVARPIVACILGIRDRAKQLSVFETEIDPDGRWRTSYNIAGTETGRLSSSSSVLGTGSNSQSLAPPLKPMFIADEGYKLYSIDLEQAESREVGLLCGLLFDDWKYLDFCEAGDLHTQACKMIWKNLPWTGVAKADKAIAEQKFYHEFTYRDMAKRGGHGSNYLGTPFTMARHLKVPPKLMEDFQDAYFGAFPSIPQWHQWVYSELQTKQTLTTPFGFERTFFGRQNDPTTHREAVAFSPQSSTAHRTNLGLLRMWEQLPRDIQLLAQVHDAIVFQAPESYDERDVSKEALRIIESVEMNFNGRVFKVPGEAKVGWNWGYRKEKDGKVTNPDGLWKVGGLPERKRTPLLERVM
jgi:DNA polymerase I